MCPLQDQSIHASRASRLRRLGRHFGACRLDTVSAHRIGFSLVELLVVVAILALLFGLVLPAVQSSRESARRATCGNHLRQIGTGLHAYHAAKKSFPPGGIEWRSQADRTQNKRQLAWSAFLLPFIEEQAVYGMLDLSKSYDSERNAAGAARVVSTYLCPSVSRSTPLVNGRGASDYGGIYGERIDWPGRDSADRRNDPPKGIMLYDRRISIREIRDGTSHTLIVSEDSNWSDGQWIDGRNIFDQAFEINNRIPFENDIRSNHPSGALGLLADGSVQFLRDELDPHTLAAICTRARGELIKNFP